MSRIRLFAAFVKANGLYRIEGFDYSPIWFNVDVDKNVPLPDSLREEIASVKCACLNVSAESFWWTAYLKHTEMQIMIETEKVAVSPRQDRLVA